MTDPAFRTMTEQEYLHWDGPREAKWEYVDGFVYAQAGASKPHGLLISNILRPLLNATDGTSCDVISNDLKVRVLRDGRPRYYLPDIVVSCDSKMVGDVETAPCLIVEVLSASTRNVDQTFKAADYQRLKSLQGYLLVDSERRGIEFYRRTAGGWELEVVEEAVALPCLVVTLSLETVYRNVPL